MSGQNICNEINNNLELLMQNKHLVHTSYNVTAVQNRIFYYCLLNAQKEKNGSLRCRVMLEDIKKLIPNTNQRTLKNIKQTLRILSDTSIEFEKNEQNGDIIECNYKLIAGSEYNVTKEYFDIYFMDRLYNHIIDYTVYAPLNLDIIVKFQTFHSQRLYELLRLWSRTEKTVVKRFKISQIRFVLCVEDKYPEYKNLKQRVIEKAVKEINEKGNMELSYNEIKVGRKVNEIEFVILDHERKTYFNEVESIIDCDDYTVADEEDTNDEIIQEPCIDEEDKTKNTKKDNKFFVPNKKLFTAKTLKDFENDYGEYDFSDSEYKRNLQEAIMITLDKFDEEKIKVKFYDYFKGVLNNKLKEIKNKKNPKQKSSKGFKANYLNTSKMTVPNENNDFVNITELDDDYILRMNKKKHKNK